MTHPVIFHQDSLRWAIALITWAIGLYTLYKSCKAMLMLRKVRDHWNCGNVEFYRACAWVEGCATVSLMFSIAQLDLFRQIYVSDPDTHTLFFWMWQGMDLGFFLLMRHVLRFISKVIEHNCPYIPKDGEDGTSAD